MSRISCLVRKRRNSSEMNPVALSVTIAVGKPVNLNVDSNAEMNCEAETAEILTTLTNLENESIITTYNFP